MLIINGGIPRSGTVLVGNLVRLMLERRGINWSRYNPQERRDLPDFLRLARQTQIDNATIVHTHLIDAEITAELAQRSDAVLIWNHRDPRDALVSLMALHDLRHEEALSAMRVYCNAAEIAYAEPGVMKIAYEDLVRDLPAYVSKIAANLRFELSPNEVDNLIRLTSLAAHQKTVDQLQEDLFSGARTLKTKRRIMREDPKTLLNDRHIQSGQHGRWRCELTKADQESVNAGLERWIRLFDYASKDL